MPMDTRPMKTGSITGTLVKAAIFVGIAYVAFNWKGLGLTGDDVQAFAESACVDAIRERYDVSRVNPYSIASNSNGYVVRATVTLSKGGSAKAICLTNTHGGVRDISITE